MASARDTIFNLDDEAAFSAALLEKFPEAVFVDKGYWPEPTVQRRASLADCESDKAQIWFPPKRWKPKFVKNSGGDYYVCNHGPRVLVYFGWRPPYMATARTWRKDGKPPAIYPGVLHVSYRWPTPELKRFSGQVWRVFAKIVSYKLLDIAVPSGRAICPTNGDRRWIAAGHHAILWAARRRGRMFNYKESSRFAPDKGCAIYPAPEAIAEARAAVLGEAPPKRAPRRKEAGPG